MGEIANLPATVDLAGSCRGTRNGCCNGNGPVGVGPCPCVLPPPSMSVSFSSAIDWLLLLLLPLMVGKRRRVMTLPAITERRRGL